MSSRPLILEHTDDDQYEVHTIGRGTIISKESMPDKAIQTARAKGYKNEILFGSGYATLNTDDLFNELELIQELAALAGMKVLCAYDDNMHILGYHMELKE